VPRPSSKLSLRAHRRSAKGAELAVDVDARGGPAIATVARSSRPPRPCPGGVFTASHHTLTDQTSVIRLIEDNWHLGRIGDGSFDELTGPITHMFDFTARRAGKLFLDRETGTPVDHAGRDG
jgi:hypothetical protein